ncbi:MAG TPA: hypothetical protein VM223_27800 [Planctomycetota bacterium]|nr:hypothetical protein [Planctomycetota bacterium]
MPTVGIGKTTFYAWAKDHNQIVGPAEDWIFAIEVQDVARPPFSTAVRTRCQAKLCDCPCIAFGVHQAGFGLGLLIHHPQCVMVPTTKWLGDRYARGPLSVLLVQCLLPTGMNASVMISTFLSAPRALSRRGRQQVHDERRHGH